jgi:hypothetical protein
MFSLCRTSFLRILVILLNLTSSTRFGIMRTTEKGRIEMVELFTLCCLVASCWGMFEVGKVVFGDEK